MSKVYEGSYKLRGLTSGSSTIGTVDIQIATDGAIVFNDANGVQKEFMPSGVVAELLKMAFTGTGAPTSRWLV